MKRPTTQFWSAKVPQSQKTGNLDPISTNTQPHSNTPFRELFSLDTGLTLPQWFENSPSFSRSPPAGSPRTHHFHSASRYTCMFLRQLWEPCYLISQFWSNLAQIIVPILQSLSSERPSSRPDMPRFTSPWISTSSICATTYNVCTELASSAYVAMLSNRRLRASDHKGNMDTGSYDGRPRKRGWPLRWRSRSFGPRLRKAWMRTSIPLFDVYLSLWNLRRNGN